MTPESALVPDTPGTPADAPRFPTDLPETDGEPLETDWHRLAIALLVEAVRYHHRDRNDFFAGGNMFLYFSAEQVRNKDYRGPDFFFVWGVDGARERRYWAVWQENGKYPHVIIELLSPSTAHEDRTTKKSLYEETFRTPEYYLYDPDTRQLEGWRLHKRNGTLGYDPIEREEHGRLWSGQLELYLGTWDGKFQDVRRTWLRFFDVHGNLIRVGSEAERERAERERLRADREQHRAELAEAELEKLKARLAKLEGGGPQGGP
jgi:Uma2 family endonuclease